ncbi:MAG: RadC family protein [Sinimarinibacterium flocculans]|uniref:DNA repair protein RadC n=1 Tax=Sinimarinibacterium flocculans TaxID=985250 RepID=A0A318EF92_9GAMM|nr:DNA repair protein RadC [Sinimarinibacterium flocculans]PXV70672.1 DNA repair protein RadC [Sinimarinibacterium flocculans]
MAITDWPESERPREKLLAAGASGLSDAELLAIFLRTGVRGMTAVDLARDLMRRFGSLRALLTASREEFCITKGLGEAKYVQLQAVMEMARRQLSEILVRGDALSSPQAAADYLRAQLRDREHEVFGVVFLDTQHRVLAYEELARGTVDGAAVYPREVVKAALRRNAAAVILAHNHPSGIAEPSAADRALTERLRQALGTIDVRVLDHLVVGDGAPVSFAERGWI